MLCEKTINTIQYMRDFLGIHPLFHKSESIRSLPCYLYSRNKVHLIDENGNFRYECAYLTNCDNVVYVDGSYDYDTGSGKIGAFFDHKNENMSKIIEEPITHPLDAEIIAICHVLDREKDSNTLEIRTDNMTCVGIFHGDLNRPIKETPYIARLREAFSSFKGKLNVGWVRGHGDWIGNIEADALTKA